MTVHRISSVLNKQVLHETLDIFCTRLLFLLLLFFLSRNECIVIKAIAKCTVSPYRFPKTRQRKELPCVFLCIFTLLSGKNMSCYFPEGFPRTLSQCERAPRGCLGQFSFNFFFFSIVTTLLRCFTDFPAVLQCLKSNAANLWLNCSEISSRSRQAWENHEYIFFRQKLLDSLLCSGGTVCGVCTQTSKAKITLTGTNWGIRPWVSYIIGISKCARVPTQKLNLLLLISTCKAVSVFQVSFRLDLSRRSKLSREHWAFPAVLLHKGMTRLKALPFVHLFPYNAPEGIISCTTSHREKNKPMNGQCLLRESWCYIYDAFFIVKKCLL